jgi:hypothetical protein
MSKPSMRDRICLTPQCENAARTRGVCSQCFQTVLYLTKRGLVTMEDLEAAGKILPKRPHGQHNFRYRHFLGQKD